MLYSLALVAHWAPLLASCVSVAPRSASVPSLSMSEIHNGSFPHYYSPRFLERSPAPDPGDGLCESQYIGCFADNVTHRALNGAFGVHSAMTGELCIGFCNGLGFVVAGTEWSTQCFCGMSILDMMTRPEDECDWRCGGNRSQACGGPVRLSVYADLGKGPATNPGNGKTFEYAGCWSDLVSDRTLPNLLSESSDPKQAPTVATCAATCQAVGFTYAGVEYGGECWCGNDLSKATLQVGDPDETGCNMPCRANQSEFCGGPDRLDVYKFPPFESPTTSSAINSSLSLATVITITTASSPVASANSSSVLLTTTPTTTPAILPSFANSSVTKTTDRVPNSPITISSQYILSTTTTPLGNSSVPTVVSSPTSSPDFMATPHWTNFSTSSVPTTSSSSMGTGLPFSATVTTYPVGNSTSASPTASPTGQEIIVNGGFEDYYAIYDDWHVGPNMFNNNTGNLYNYTNSYGDFYAYQGRQAFLIYDEGSDSATRSLCISQRAFHPRAGTYSVSAYIGRIPYNGPKDDSSSEILLYEIDVDNVRVKYDKVCDPALNQCTVVDISGTLSYNLVTYQVVLTDAEVGYHTLSICATYIGMATTHDDFIVDNVSILAPL